MKDKINKENRNFGSKYIILIKYNSKDTSIL